VTKHAHKIGAVFYILWGIFHAYIGILLLSKVIGEGTGPALAAIGNALPASQIPQANIPVMNGVIAHYSWNLVWFGAYAIVLAIFMNWKNSRVGYWFNLVVVSLTDLGFIFAILVPGYITFAAGATGPILWVIAAIFTTIGILQPSAANARFEGTALGRA
jgi:hypothetical protein